MFNVPQLLIKKEFPRGR